MLGAVLSIGGAILGGIGGAAEARARNREKRRQIEAQRKAARYRYSGVEAATKLKIEINREQSQNLVTEAARAGAAKKRKVKAQEDIEAGKVLARSEGLTSGNSAGRQMVSLYSKGAKAIQQVNKQEINMINKITQDMDNKTNTYSNQQLKAYQDMSAILKSEHGLENPTGSIVRGAIGGYKLGSAIGSGISDIDFGGAGTTDIAGAAGVSVPSVGKNSGSYPSGDVVPIYI